MVLALHLLALASLIVITPIESRTTTIKTVNKNSKLPEGAEVRLQHDDDDPENRGQRRSNEGELASTRKDEDKRNERNKDERDEDNKGNRDKDNLGNRDKDNKENRGKGNKDNRGKDNNEEKDNRNNNGRNDGRKRLSKDGRQDLDKSKRNDLSKNERSMGKDNNNNLAKEKENVESKGKLDDAVSGRNKKMGKGNIKRTRKMDNNKSNDDERKSENPKNGQGKANGKSEEMDKKKDLENDKRNNKRNLINANRQILEKGKGKKLNDDDSVKEDEEENEEFDNYQDYSEERPRGSIFLPKNFNHLQMGPENGLKDRDALKDYRNDYSKEDDTSEMNKEKGNNRRKKSGILNKRRKKGRRRKKNGGNQEKEQILSSESQKTPRLLSQLLNKHGDQELNRMKQTFKGRLPGKKNMRYVLQIVSSDEMESGSKGKKRRGFRQGVVNQQKPSKNANNQNVLVKTPENVLGDPKQIVGLAKPPLNINEAKLTNVLNGAANNEERRPIKGGASHLDYTLQMLDTNNQIPIKNQPSLNNVPNEPVNGLREVGVNSQKTNEVEIPAQSMQGQIGAEEKQILNYDNFDSHFKEQANPLGGFSGISDIFKGNELNSGSEQSNGNGLNEAVPKDQLLTTVATNLAVPNIRDALGISANRPQPLLSDARPGNKPLEEQSQYDVILPKKQLIEEQSQYDVILPKKQIIEEQSQYNAVLPQSSPRPVKRRRRPLRRPKKKSKKRRRKHPKPPRRPGKNIRKPPKFPNKPPKKTFGPPENLEFNIESQIKKPIKTTMVHDRERGITSDPCTTTATTSNVLAGVGVITRETGVKSCSNEKRESNADPCKDNLGSLVSGLLQKMVSGIVNSVGSTVMAAVNAGVADANRRIMQELQRIKAVQQQFIGRPRKEILEPKPAILEPREFKAAGVPVLQIPKEMPPRRRRRRRRDRKRRRDKRRGRGKKRRRGRRRFRRRRAPTNEGSFFSVAEKIMSQSLPHKIRDATINLRLKNTKALIQLVHDVDVEIESEAREHPDSQQLGKLQNIKGEAVQELNRRGLLVDQEYEEQGDQIGIQVGQQQ